MQVLDLNLASRPAKNNTLIWVGLGLVLLGLVAFSVWNWRTYSEYDELLVSLTKTVNDYEGELGDLQKREDEALLRIERYDLKSLNVQADKANEVIRWKAFSWTRLFNLLESVQPHGVRMTSVHPIFRARRGQAATDERSSETLPISVDGVAKSLQDFADFQRALQADPHFDRVEPDRIETAEQTGETIFQLRFLYSVEAAEPAEDAGQSAALLPSATKGGA